MKRHLRRILSLGLALILTVVLGIPAAASQLEKSERALFALVGFASEEEAQESYGLDRDRWEEIAGNYEQFDPQEYFNTSAFYQEYESTEAYLDEWGMTQEELDEEIVNDWFLNELYQDYPWVPTQLTQEEEEWLAAHPQQAADFDPAAWFQDSWYSFSFENLDQFQSVWELDDETAALALRKDWVSQQLQVQAEAQWQQEFIAAHPQEYAQFDPDRWYVEEHGGAYAYETPERYMQAMNLTREAFVAEMQRDWVMALSGWELDQEWMDQEKEQAGGTPDGVNVMVDGVCISYPGLRPALVEDQVLVPLGPTMRYLGVQQGWDHMGAATLYHQGTTLYHKPGTAQARLVAQDGTTDTLELGTASYLQDEEIMIPLAPLVQAMGFQCGWDGVYETLVLVDTAAFQAQVSPRFTHIDQIMDTVWQALLPQAQRAREMQYNLKLEFEGADVLLTGTERMDERASNVELALSIPPELLNLDQLDIETMTQQERELLAQLDGLRLEGIVDFDQGVMYLRSPLFALLGGPSDTEAWVLTPSDLAMSVGDQLLALTAGGQLPSKLSMGQQLLSRQLDGEMSFHSYDDLQLALGEVALLADENWVSADGGWRLSLSRREMIAFELGMTSEEVAQTTEEEWAELELWYSDLPTLDLWMAPVGADCKYQVDLQSSGEDTWATTLKLSGRPGRLEVEVELDLGELEEGVGRISFRYALRPASQLPVTAPAAGDQIVPVEGLSL